ncbi:MAG: hypothetical protein IT381_31865 [Deltaproteobacteria bacterium]|nr:hypothetical protein [Deltaproteobacteria bacterium]
MEAFVNGARVRLDPKRLIGQGGEAEVYDLGDGRVLKRFKPPSHPDFAGLPDAQLAAGVRLREHEDKLPALMRLALPAAAVKPEALATDKRGLGGGGLIGYVMRKIEGALVLADLAQATARRGAGGGERNVAVLRTLRAQVLALHRAGVTLGDFNDLNVLVCGDDVFLIDADSYQFDRFVCRVFSDRFVDPRLLAAAGGAATMVRPHDQGSDWYAYAVMLMQLLLLAGPYAGVYRPQDASKRLPPSLRPLERITVFHPQVQYPKPALPLATLPDAVLGFLEETCVRDLRTPPPPALLDTLRFTRCTACGGEHGRAVCPFCTQAARVVHRSAVRGKVHARSIVRTEGTLVAVHDSGAHWLCHEDDAFVRETKERVLSGRCDPTLRFGLLPHATLVSNGRTLAILDAGGARRRSIAPHAFAAFGDDVVFVGQDAVVRLADQRDPFSADEPLGGVLEGDAHVWLGSRFGLGVYRAGELAVGYVFSPNKRGLVDSLRPACIRGRVLEMGCVLGELGWLSVAREVAGARVDACILIDPRGQTLAAVEGDARDLPWLASAKLGAAVDHALLVPTDAGVVRVEATGGTLAVTRVFSDTEPFVDAGCRLIATKDALLVHDAHELRALTMEVSS